MSIREFDICTAFSGILGNEINGFLRKTLVNYNTLFHCAELTISSRKYFDIITVHPIAKLRNKGFCYINDIHNKIAQI